MRNSAENNRSDHDLVKKALGGDISAFSAIVSLSERLVSQIIFKMVHNSPDRKDILQEVYLKVYKSLGGFKFQSKITTWIARITYHACLDYLSKNRHVLIGDTFNLAHDGEFDGDNDNEKLTASDHTECKLVKSELAGILKSKIAMLPPIYQTLITLYHNEELSYEEIGEITGLPDGTVKNYLYRARKELKRILLKDYSRDDL